MNKKNNTSNFGEEKGKKENQNKYEHAGSVHEYENT